DYYNGYYENGEYKPGYRDLITDLTTQFPLGQPIIGEKTKKSFIQLYGAILRIQNILTSFDEFEGNEILSERDFQDYQSIYIDLYQEFRKGADADKEVINDDIIFEIELILQVEVNIDYILMLVAKYRDSDCQDKNILVTIDKAINSSIVLRSKKELIEDFIGQVNISTIVDEDWRKFLHRRKEEDLTTIIKEEKLKEQQTRRLIDNAFRDGTLKTTGTAIDRIMPAASRFDNGKRAARKLTIIERLLKFFEKYFGLI
ncbi:MAG TPA: type I restriction endonuclease subunit R, partial [Atribacterota bacterium]|nr:type I restriction endonuclease subunit R [Atribacterota bacterium]